MNMTWLSTLVLSITSFVGGLFGGVPETINSVATTIPEHIAQVSESAGSTLSAVSSTTAKASGNAGAAWKTTLPLGDGKYVTNGPKKGYVYLCNTGQGGGGAQVVGSWIQGTTWNPGEKLKVQGAVEWPSASYRMTVSGTKRTITTNDLPLDHTTGVFPIQKTDPAYQIDRNPSAITAQDYTFSLPAAPVADTEPNCIYGMVGIMNNGVLLFDAFDAEYRDALAHEVQDSNDGHPNNSGYHKHGFITAIKDMNVRDVVGFAFDGFPITGPKLPNGNYLTTADLDECHGMEGEVVLDGKKQTIYHYVLTQDFPYSVGCFKGRSYEPTPGRGMATGVSSSQSTPAQAGGATPKTPPAEAIAACSGKQQRASCSFATATGSITGVCDTPPQTTVQACIPGR